MLKKSQISRPASAVTTHRRYTEDMPSTPSR
jgi:hypothetical protein